MVSLPPHLSPNPSPFSSHPNTHTGWWLAKMGAKQGWAPSAYLKEEAPPPPPPPVARPNGVNGAAGAKPRPPAPPAKRPAAGRKTAPATVPAARDSGLSMGGGRDTPTPTPSLAGGLAEALRARQSAMQGGRRGEEEDDW